LKKFLFILIIEIDEKRLRKKVALIMTDYEEQQPTPAGYAQLATPRANYFLLVLTLLICLLFVTIEKFLYHFK
jgi:hypothetical protein